MGWPRLVLLLASLLQNPPHLMGEDHLEALPLYLQTGSNLITHAHSRILRLQQNSILRLPEVVGETGRDNTTHDRILGLASIAHLVFTITQPHVDLN